MKKKTPPPTAEIAKKFNVHPRTIRGWKSAGAPLNDPKAMRKWLSTRKNIPPNLRSTVPDAPTMAGDEPETPEAELGAAAALRRLERAEASAYNRLQRAVRSRDPVEIKSTRETWLRVSESLRKYDKAVEDTRRERGELVRRDEVLNGLRTLATWLRLSHQSICDCNLLELAGDLCSPPGARRIIRRLGYVECLAANAAVVMSVGVPAWFLEPFKQDLVDEIGPVDHEVEAIRAAVKDYIRLGVQKVVAAEH